MPDIAGLRDSRSVVYVGNRICRICLGFIVQRQGLQGNVDFGQFEAGDGQIKIDIEVGQILKLERQQIRIPAGVFRQPVVGNDIGPDSPFTIQLTPQRLTPR